MLIRVKRGWELAGERGDRRGGFPRPQAAAERAGGRADPGLGGRRTSSLGRRRNGPVRRALSGQAQRPLPARPADHRLRRRRRPTTISTNSASTNRSGSAPRRSSSVPGRSRSTGMVEKPLTIDFDDLLKKIRSRSGSTATAASRRGRWRCRGPGFRWRRWSISRARSARPNTCGWKPSSTRRPRPSRRSSCIPGPMSRG